MRRWVPILLLAFLAGCGQDAASVPDRAVIDQAEGFHKAIASAALDDPRFARYVQEVGDRVVAAAKAYYAQQPSNSSETADWMFSKNMLFHVLSSDLPSATTAGGQHVYIYAGLLEQCDSEDQLAAVLACAYAHVYARHVRNNFPAQADAPPVVVEQNLISARFTPAQEIEADRLAVQFYARGGWDPSHFSAIFQKLGAAAPRISAMQGTIDQLPPVARDWQRPPVADQRRFAQHRQEAADQLRNKPSGPALALYLTALPDCIGGVDSPAQKAAQDQVLHPPTNNPPPAFEKGFGPR